MQDRTVIYTVETGGIARLTLNRPEVRHALDHDVMNELASLLAQIDADPDVRVVVIGGSQHCFSAGLDISWMKSLASSRTSDDARRFGHLLLELKHLHKPTIAAIDGICMGAGVALATCCDILVATDQARFSLPAPRIGAAPSTVAPFIVDAIGAHQAKRYLMTGEEFTPEDARDIGLVHIICQQENMHRTIEELIANLRLGGPQALADCKEIINIAERTPLSKIAIEDAAKRTVRIRKSPEAREGLAAFLEKRKPRWLEES